jgi:hypothetical protein
MTISSSGADFWTSSEAPKREMIHVPGGSAGRSVLESPTTRELSADESALEDVRGNRHFDRLRAQEKVQDLGPVDS